MGLLQDIICPVSSTVAKRPVSTLLKISLGDLSKKIPLSEYGLVPQTYTREELESMGLFVSLHIFILH